jgi:hypothetical protein
VHRQCGSFADGTRLLRTCRRRGSIGRDAPSPALHPNVIEAMGEIGIDLSGASPHGFERADGEWADIVVTMGCGDECPVAGTSYRDWPIDDPIGLSVEETRPIRDEIARRVAALVAELRVESSGYLSDGFAERYDLCRPGLDYGTAVRGRSPSRRSGSRVSGRQRSEFWPIGPCRSCSRTTPCSACADPARAAQPPMYLISTVGRVAVSAVRSSE